MRVSTWEECVGLRISPGLETGVASLSSYALARRHGAPPSCSSGTSRNGFFSGMTLP